MFNVNGVSIKKTSGGILSTIENNTYTILCMINGRKKIFVNNTLYNIGRGEIILIDSSDISNDRSSLLRNETNAEYYTITISPSFLETLKDMVNSDILADTFNFKKILIPKEKMPYFETLIHNLYAEQSDPTETHSVILTRLYTSELLIILDRFGSDDGSQSNNITIQEQNICDVCRHICNYYNEQLTLTEMAAMAYMSPTYFSKNFKKITGFGFNEYLNSVRVKIAINMLLNTNHSIAQIAVFCGYQDSNYFGDVFRRIMGISPSKYRKTYAR